MRAAVLYEAQTPMYIEDVSVDGPKADEVLVQIRATGACHSDYHVIDGSWNGPGYPLPVILGHEAAGIVEKVGADVSTLQPGDPVILSFAPNCGRCRMCTIGQPHLCWGMRNAAGTFPSQGRFPRRRLRASGSLVGRCGLNVTNADLREAVVWYSLHRSLWGQIYIPEGLRCLVDFGFRAIGATPDLGRL